MKKLLFPALFATLILLAGCAGMFDQATPTVEVAFTLEPTLSVDNTLKEDLEPSPYFPKPGDSELTKGSAIISSVYVLFSSSEPQEVLIHLNGYLPTPCHELRVVIPEPDINNDIFLEVYSLTEPDQICEQVLRAYDVTVNLGSYPKGSYWVWVNGGKAGNFDF